MSGACEPTDMLKWTKKFDAKWAKYGHIRCSTWEWWCRNAGKTSEEGQEAVGAEKSIRPDQLILDWDYCMDGCPMEEENTFFDELNNRPSMCTVAEFDGSGDGLVYGCEVYLDRRSVERKEVIEVVEPKSEAQLILRSSGYEDTVNFLVLGLMEFNPDDVVWFVNERLKADGKQPETAEQIDDWWTIGSEFLCERGFRVTYQVQDGGFVLTID